MENVGDTIKEAIKASSALGGDKGALLLKLLASYEGEMQARDVALGALKGEHVKSLLEKLEDGDELRCYKQDPLFAIQRDSLVSKLARSQPVNSKDSVDYVIYLKQQISLSKHKQSLKKAMAYLKESERQRQACTTELKQLREALKKKEDVEKKAKDKDFKADEADSEKKDNASLSEELEKLKLQLKEERENKQQIVLVLCNDRKQIATRYLQEQRRTEGLARALRTTAMELEEESKKSLALEADLDKNKKLLVDERRKYLEVEEALRRCKQEADHLRKQLAEAHRVAMSQASVATTLPNQNTYVTRNPSPESYSAPQPSESMTGSLGKSMTKSKLIVKDSRGVKTDTSASTSVTTTGGMGKKISMKSLGPPPVPPNKPIIIRNSNSTGGSASFGSGPTSGQQTSSHLSSTLDKMSRFLTEQ